MSRHGLLFRLLTLLVVLSPLPFGSNRPVVWSLMALLVGGLLLVWGWLWYSGRARLPVAGRRLWLLALPFALAVLWVLVQQGQWTPAGWHHPLWRDAGLAGRITLDPMAGYTALMRLLTYGGIFWLAVQVGRRADRAAMGLRWLAGAGILYALYGLAQHFAGIDYILWLPKWAYLGDLTSTFVNRNAYGAYAGLGFVTCLAIVLGRIAAERRGIRGLRDAVDLLLTRTVPYLVAIVILGTALMLSHSRGAFLATAAAVLVLLLLCSAARLIPVRLAAAFTGVILLIGGAAVAVSGDVTFSRLAETTDLQGDRGNLYRLAGDAISEAPLTGHGYGAFNSAFRLYRDVSLPRPVGYDFAHNLHLEVLMDLGIPGAVLLYFPVGVILVLCGRAVFVRQRDQIYPALAVAVLVLVGGHGLVDFSPQIPAIAITVAFVLGLGMAQVWSSRPAPEPMPEQTAEEPRR